MSNKKDYIILLDGGHGVNTPGKQSPDGLLKEYAYAREIVKRIFNSLKELGYEPYILVPETETPETMDGAELELEIDHANVIDAAASGASDGLQLALNVGAVLIAFVALIALVNFLISSICGLFGAPYINLNWILGRIFST